MYLYKVIVRYTKHEECIISIAIIASMNSSNDKYTTTWETATAFRKKWKLLLFAQPIYQVMYLQKNHNKSIRCIIIPVKLYYYNLLPILMGLTSYFYITYRKMLSNYYKLVLVPFFLKLHRQSKDLFILKLTFMSHVCMYKLLNVK